MHPYHKCHQTSIWMSIICKINKEVVNMKHLQIYIKSNTRMKMTKAKSFANKAFDNLMPLSGQQRLTNNNNKIIESKIMTNL